MTPDRCPTCKRRHRRSTDANRRYWAIVHRVAELLKPQGHNYSADSWHVWFRSRFLGCKDFVLPNGKAFSIPHSTAELDVSEFSTYMTQVEAWANEHDVFLEDEALA